jgi:F-type H+-transporting ATPase subunit delta
MKLSKESRKLSRDLFQASFVDGKLNPERVRTIAAKIADSKPRQYIDILKEFQRLVRLEVSKHHAQIESQLEESLRAKYGSDLTTDFKVTPELIGGLRVKIGSDVFDGSVRERLSRLQAQMAHA